MRRTLLLLLLAGCPTPPEPPPAGPPERIVSLLPSFTEILTEMGCTDRLVGVTSFAPKSASHIRSVGGLTNPDLEAIFALQPDLVLGIRSKTTVPIRKKLEEGSVPTLFLPNETLDDAMNAITEIGRKVDRSDQAKALRERIEKKMADIEKRAKGKRKVRVAIAVQVQPLILAGKGSFLDELITRAGGENIAHDSDRPYPQLSLETFSVRAPEVIIDVTTEFQKDIWNRLPSTPAHQNDRIHPLPPGVPIDPGPRVHLLMNFIEEKLGTGTN